MLSSLNLRVKTQKYFVSWSNMFLDKKTLLKIWLNPGLNLTIFGGTGPRWFRQAAHFSTINTINKPALNYRRILIAAVSFCTSSRKKTVKNMISWRYKTLSASAIRKQVSSCCIHFPHELTCQILSNQSIKIRRRARPTRDHGEKSQKRLPSLHVTAGWIFACEVSLKSKFERCSSWT